MITLNEYRHPFDSFEWLLIQILTIDTLTEKEKNLDFKFYRRMHRKLYK